MSVVLLGAKGTLAPYFLVHTKVKVWLGPPLFKTKMAQNYYRSLGHSTLKNIPRPWFQKCILNLLHLSTRSGELGT